MDLWSLLRIVRQRSLRSCRLEFEDRGAHALKGVPGEWQLFAVR